jgi:hypothetical protein
MRRYFCFVSVLLMMMMFVTHVSTRQSVSLKPLFSPFGCLSGGVGRGGVTGWVIRDG